MKKTPAGFWIRLAAFLLDVLILFLPLIFISDYVLNVFGFSYSYIQAASPTNEFNKSLHTIIPALLFCCLNVIFVTSLGATPGKLIYGLKIVDKKGKIPSLGVAFLREIIGKAASSIGLYIGFLYIGADSEKQGFHDKIASTHVYIVKPLGLIRKSSLYLLPFSPLIFIIIMIFFFSIMAKGYH